MRRICCLLLTLGALLSLASTADAAYENTHINTGDQRSDIVAVAVTQLGYTEGYNNDTKYGDWYGLPNHPWCAMFVSWCANQAGVPTTVIQKAAIANPTYFGFSSWFSASEQMPRSGDLFFKKGFYHMGLVWYIEGDYFYTVEGNTNTTGGDGVGVYSVRRNLKDYYFVSPNYTSDPGHNYYTSYESAHPHKEYQKCDHCGQAFYTGSNVTLAACATCIMENCTHSFGDWSPAQDTHLRKCTLCGKEQTDGHSFSGGTVTQEATCGQVGYMDQECAVCGQSRAVTLPATGDHSYSQFEGVDENAHSRVCESCQQVDMMSHEPEPEYSMDAMDHWYDCTDCDQRLRSAPHSFGPVCGDPCADCGYQPAEGHVFTGEDRDGDGHWNYCVNCGQAGERQAHLYDNACDTDCGHCGWEREITHSLEPEWLTDGTSHWHRCQVCGILADRQVHDSGAPATEEAAQLCTVCGYELAARLVHIHSYAPYSKDDHYHWGTCVCGDALEPQLHGWDINTGLCSVCGAQSIAKPADQSWDYIWLAAFGIPGLGILTLLLIWIFRKRKK